MAVAVEPRDTALRPGQPLTIRCSPRACSSASARRPTAASASRSSSASFPSASARRSPAHSWLAALLGQVLGVAVGGAVAAAHGWRMAFMAIGVAGLLLAIIYPLVVRETRLRGDGGSAARSRSDSRISEPCSPGRALKCAYVGSGLPAVRRRCLARVAADLFRPLLRPAAEAGDVARRLVPRARGSGDDCVRDDQRQVRARNARSARSA